MIRRLAVAAAWFLAQSLIAAPETSGIATPAEAEAEVSVQSDLGPGELDSDLIIPPARSESRNFQQPADLGKQVRMTLYMLCLMGGGAALLVWWQRQRKQPGKGLTLTGQIEICETRPLGSRQYLAVVRYRKQRMLIGVGPDRIDHLCPLESSGEEIDEEIQTLPAPSAFNRLLKK